MFRRVFNTYAVQFYNNIGGQTRRHTHGGGARVVPKNDNMTEVECLYENYLNRPEIDSWELRKAMCELHGMDMIPSPPVIIAAMKACRRNNDYSLAVRILEAVKFKCGPKLCTIWPYILQEIGPTLEELGVDTPEQLGYDKPELWLDQEN